jgi:phosphoglycolate phosphatase-like HAD superfamily hydrolase
MIEKAVADLNIDLSQSWLIGDTTTDVQTAKNAGLKSILLRTGHGGNDGKHEVRPDFVTDKLLDAVRLLLAQTSK